MSTVYLQIIHEKSERDRICSIACLRAEGDALIPEGFLPCQGMGPRDFDIVGDKIVCTNETSDTMMVLDKQTGKLLSALCLPKLLRVTVLPPEKTCHGIVWN